jgi:hypothetical protein
MESHESPPRDPEHAALPWERDWTESDALVPEPTEVPDAS